MLTLLLIGFIFRGAAETVVKCCYANPFDCDSPGDWCSKSKKQCVSCQGQLVTEQEQRLQARMEVEEKARAEKKFHEAKQTQAVQFHEAKRQQAVHEAKAPASRQEAEAPAVRSAPLDQPVGGFHEAKQTQAVQFHEAKRQQAVHEAKAPAVRHEAKAPAVRSVPLDQPKTGESALEKVFPVDLTSRQCMNLLHEESIDNAHACESACAQAPSCELWQWCPEGKSCSPADSCWIGSEASLSSCKYEAGSGWVSAARAGSQAITLDARNATSGGGLLSFSAVLFTGSMIGFIISVALKRTNDPSLSRPLIEVAI